MRMPNRPPSRGQASYPLMGSTCRCSAFVLRSHGIELLVDVRRSPASRRHPHFNRERLGQALPEAGTDYLWLGEALGGRRSGREDSPHTAWKVKGFAAYADHTDSEEFERAAGKLAERARHRRTAFMCAEMRWESCHRRLISDWLTVRGWEVIHLVDAERTEAHRLPDFSRVEGRRILYDGGQMELPTG